MEQEILNARVELAAEIAQETKKQHGYGSPVHRAALEVFELFDREANPASYAGLEYELFGRGAL